jgi:excinuclease UvrABC nuclease subunit
MDEAAYQRRIEKIQRLPSVTFRERTLLPRVSGVYFVFNTYGELLYVGKAKNLRERWRYHHRATQVRGDYRIHWILGSDAAERERRETIFINMFRPPWNGSFKQGESYYL